MKKQDEMVILDWVMPNVPKENIVFIGLEPIKGVGFSLNAHQQDEEEPNHWTLMVVLTTENERSSLSFPARGFLPDSLIPRNYAILLDAFFRDNVGPKAVFEHMVSIILARHAKLEVTNGGKNVLFKLFLENACLQGEVSLEDLERFLGSKQKVNVTFVP